MKENRILFLHDPKLMSLCMISSIYLSRWLLCISWKKFPMQRIQICCVAFSGIRIVIILFLCCFCKLEHIAHYKAKNKESKHTENKCAWMRAHVCMHTHHTHAHTHICMHTPHTCMHTHTTHMHTHIHKHTYTHMHKRMHTHTHTHNTHTHTHTQ